MQKLRVRPEFLDLYRSQVSAQEGKFTQALRTLNALRPRVLNAPQLLIPVDMLRADCYGARNQRDLQIEAYRQVLFVNPAYVPARRGLGEALYRSGQIREASEELSTLAAGGDGLALLALMQVSIQQQLRLAPEQRDWSYCDGLLEQLAEKIPDESRMTALRIDYLARKGDYAAARELLLPLSEASPKELSLWVARIDLASEERGIEAANEELTAARAALGDVLPLKQAQVALHVRKGDEESRKALEEMAAGIEELPEEERKSVRMSLANAFSLLGDRDRAVQLLEAIAKEDPNELNARMSLFRVARETGDDAKMQQSLEQIKKLMGDNTFWEYGEAARIVAAVARKDRPLADLKAAQKLLDGPLAQRPNWGACTACWAKSSSDKGTSTKRLFDFSERSNWASRLP